MKEKFIIECWDGIDSYIVDTTDTYEDALVLLDRWKETKKSFRYSIEKFIFHENEKCTTERM